MNDNEKTELLKKSRVIAVVGLSADPSRASFHVTEYLIKQGYEIYGVNPQVKEVLGRPCFASLKEIPKSIDIVDVFRKSEAVPEIVEAAISVSAKAIWLQEGVTNPVAEDRARKAGLYVESDRCILKEHMRLIK